MLVPSRCTARKGGEEAKGALDLQIGQTSGTAGRTRGFTPRRTVVLVGLMGAGKTKIGRRLATRLNLPFFDSDDEMDAATRAAIVRRGVSVWLRADLDVLLARVSRRRNRPLLQQDDPRTVLAELIERRYPVYAEADLVIDSGEGPAEQTVTRAIATLAGCERASQPPDPESEA
jgi:shikimate kinase